ncbi:uncharacterized protein B0J16DRAFT_411347 [Fusarium flagelliforme]|uniref:YMC020W-like alpha/beta hydrolase domain-containing protein n=1 Tax=Fusarium flagelliforme TaxID=2675880 RepID=A0A395MX51_9HYPO|nr:uncharacterized protein B0J16DRAFT_411347 [Fusarium flagelliforme]KAH7192660.1 hypothetical protein B0J16DRAFT_411347 [Fusarium flagelliforme]RFN52501.1 hypothetical protein FIE12Z_3262 [Fusarium flagelliforme]
MVSRKKARPNPEEMAIKDDAQTLVSTSTIQTQTPTSQSQASQASPAAETDQNINSEVPSEQHIMGGSDTVARRSSKDAPRPRSWYGSWPRVPKASASTSVAKENIFGGTVKSNKSPDLSRYEAKKSDDNASILSTTDTIKTMPKIKENKSDVTMTEDDAQNKSQSQVQPDVKQSRESSKITESQESSENAGIAETTTHKPQESEIGDAQPKSQADMRPAATIPQNEAQHPPTTSSGWLGWWSRTPFTETQTTPVPDTSTQKTTEIEEATKEADTPRPVTPPAQTEPLEQMPSPKNAEEPQTTSWFRYWYPLSEPTKAPENSTNTQQQQEETSTKPPSEDVAMTDSSPPAKQNESTPKSGSTWAFWSRESPKTKESQPSPEDGEVAVMGEGSETHPRPMAESEVSPTKGSALEDSKTKDTPTPVKSRWMKKKNKRARPQSMDLDHASPSASGASTPTRTGTPTQDTDKTPAKVASSDQSIAESEASTKLPGGNLLLPSFSSTYHMKDNPSIVKQLTQLLLRTQQAPPNHVFRVDKPPKIKKAIAIGVHGLFPATYLRPMIGQPTGTSLRFAALGAEGIRRWAESHGCGDCEIEKVALEGEGKIQDRVDNLWKLMLNWIDHIRKADLVLIACHSQGVPVSIMLLEKLIDLGIITNAKVGVCAMAGVALGPFPDYKSSLLMGSAAELWEFGNAESDNSKRFENALKRVVDYGARVTFIGSIDDQLVPMESAVYSPANHPYIYRAVFIDGRVHAPDFIAHLVGFALKLRNLGVSDHGLIRELSVPLAGSLYSGAGHSRLYFDDAVYDLAIAHALETAPAGPAPAPCTISPRNGPLTSQNPYVLPWIMRGILEENFVRTELSSEADELLKQFDDWKPTNKALKDVKYRLEAVRSKL